MGRTVRIRKADVILIAVLIAAAAALWAVTELTAEAGSSITVSVDGEVKWTLPLDEDTVMRIEYPGGGYNMLVVENGTAQVCEADCPDLKCVHMKKISRDGECIICLPHKLVIQVHSSEKSDVDTIAQ
ncbi:MAG: NusG domain II-containing protein [Eubacteriaceae bacterium]|nr:NusG domain II-containing protein [Eubacteriaceae bacterium]